MPTEDWDIEDIDMLEPERFETKLIKKHEAKLIEKQNQCGPTCDETACACGCTGYDERCEYWQHCYDNHEEVAPSHRCCKTGWTEGLG